VVIFKKKKKGEVPHAAAPEYSCGNNSCDENGWRALAGRRVITGACIEQRLQQRDYGLERWFPNHSTLNIWKLAECTRM
jgi:hypothetical protein